MRKGYFGAFGGRFVPELLVPPLAELEDAVDNILPSEAFVKDMDRVGREFVGRPTPLYPCRNLSGELGFDVYLKREDLAHTGAHKINNTVGQALLARHMGKRCLLAETGAGQHGVATATAAAMLGLDCIVFMGALDVQRQSINVHRMELMGARVEPVESGTRTLKDAINAALRYWIAHQSDTHYCLGSAVGPHPFPLLVRKLQSVIGREAREQMLEQTGNLPDTVVACVGGGSNAIGMFHPFVEDRQVELVGVEAGGRGGPEDYHSATISRGTPGVLHGTHTFLLQSTEGQILPSHSVAPGLDYPGVGPEHSFLKDSNRARYEVIHDREALKAFNLLSRKEGIIPALESAHAVAWAVENKDSIKQGSRVLINLSGRGDKDLDIVREQMED